jgi:hypothetical protein
VLTGLKNWWRGAPDVAKIMKSEAIENIPDVTHKAKIWSEKLTKDFVKGIEESMAGAIKNINGEIDSLSIAAREAKREWRQAETAFSTVETLVNDATAKAVKARGAARDADLVAKKYIQEIEDLHQANMDVPRGIELELERAAIKSQSAKRSYKYWSDIAASNQTKLARKRQIMEANEEAWKLARDKEAKLLDYLQRIETSPQSVAQEVVSNPGIAQEFKSLGSWVRAGGKSIDEKHQIMKATSRYIRSSDRKFVKEYITEVYPNAKAGRPVAMRWLANPENATRLEGLRHSKKFRELLIELEHGKEFRESLRGLTSSQIARKLKIAGVAGAGLTGAVAFMTWFDEEGDEIAEQTTDAVSKIDSFRPSGLGAIIVQETKKALKTINKAKGTTESGLSKKPEKAAPVYIKTLIEQKAILDKNLARWNIVVRSADNPDTAREVGDALVIYSKTLEKQLGDVGRLTETTKRPGTTPEPGIAGDIRREPISRERIKSVQNYLSAEFPTVGPTGNLDRPTIRALKILEREYDRLGRTDRFSSGRLLVRPDERHLIELGDLKQLDERMQGYK